MVSLWKYEIKLKTKPHVVSRTGQKTLCPRVQTRGRASNKVVSADQEYKPNRDEWRRSVHVVVIIHYKNKVIQHQLRFKLPVQPDQPRSGLRQHVHLKIGQEPLGIIRIKLDSGKPWFQISTYFDIWHFRERHRTPLPMFHPPTLMIHFQPDWKDEIPWAAEVIHESGETLTIRHHSFREARIAQQQPHLSLTFHPSIRLRLQSKKGS